MEEGIEVPPKPHGERIETPDGKKVYLFRYENVAQENKNQNSSVSDDRLIGSWFTDSISNLKDYIRKKQPGGVIKVIEMPKNGLEELKAINHPIARNMDIEPMDNYIIPDEQVAKAREFPLEITPQFPHKFLFTDARNINDAVDNLLEKIKLPEQVPQS